MSGNVKEDDTDMESSDQMSTFLEYGSEKREEDRVLWSKKIESMLSFVGLCVGLGNLWRFPYLCMRNGGGAFLIPFFICLITCGLPLYFLELSLGQFSGKDALHTWEICPIFRGMGLGMLIAVGTFNLFYVMVIAWTLYYIWHSFISPLPWRSCDNSWNTQHCVTTRKTFPADKDSQWTNTSNYPVYNNSSTDLRLSNASDETFINMKTKYIMSEEEFWQFKTLEMTSGLEDFGGIKWDMALCLLIASVLVFLCISRGVKSIGKVVYVTALLPYILLTIILVRALFLPGSLDGILFFITPDFTKLKDVRVWIEAVIQVFYSLCISWGVLITMASSNKFDNNCYRDEAYIFIIERDSVLLTFICEGTSIYGGFAVFAVLGFMAHEAELSISTVVKSGPGLGFVVYPEALSQLPVSNLWAVLFFVMLMTVGLDTQFADMETLIRGFYNHFPGLKNKHLLVTGVVCAVYFIPSLILCSRAGIYVYQLLDWYVAVAVPLFALSECLVIGWIYGAERYSKDIELMIKRPLPVFMRICWCFVTPALVLILFIFTLISYQPPTYGDYVYPSYVNMIGWLIGILPLVPVIVGAFITVRNSPGNTFIQRLKSSFRPSNKWKPASTKHAQEYYLNQDRQSLSVFEQMKVNIVGGSMPCKKCTNETHV